MPDGQADCWLAVYAFLEILREICSFRRWLEHLGPVHVSDLDSSTFCDLL